MSSIFTVSVTIKMNFKFFIYNYLWTTVADGSFPKRRITAFKSSQTNRLSPGECKR